MTPGVRNQLTVSCEDPRHGGAARLVGRALRAALRRLARNPGAAALRKGVSFEVHIVSDRTMRAVNRALRNIDAPTNVLSFVADGKFPYPPARRKSYIGEIYLAPRCAGERGDDLAHLAVHALLHLLGYTHDRRHDTIRMEAEERRLLANA